MSKFLTKIFEEEFEFSLEQSDGDSIKLLRDGKSEPYSIKQNSLHHFTVTKDGKNYDIHTHRIQNDFQVIVDGSFVDFELKDEKALRREMSTSHGADVGGAIKAPMPGKVVKVLVKEGQEVNQGNDVVIIEAMKMENVFTAPCDGTVESVAVTSGDSVESGTLLVRIAN